MPSDEKNIKYIKININKINVNKITVQHIVNRYLNFVVFSKCAAHFYTWLPTSNAIIQINGPYLVSRTINVD